MQMFHYLFCYDIFSDLYGGGNHADRSIVADHQ